MHVALWAWLVPAVAAVLMAAASIVPVGTPLAWTCGFALMGAVIAAVHHAEVIAHRVGEPYGTLVLSVSVTAIEVALIMSVMLQGGAEHAMIARDTIFSVIMITCNGFVGLCVLIGALRHREQSFHVAGSNAALATLMALTALSLVLPMFTTSSPGPTYNDKQLIYASVASVVLWASFIFVQTVRHRDYFLPVGTSDGDTAHAPAPSTRLALTSFAVLLLSLVAVVGLAHVISPHIEAAVIRAGAPKEVFSIAIAMLTLLPEGWAAARSALADRLQNSLNLSLGSSLASIGLTIPAVAIASMVVRVPMVLGLSPKDLALLVLTFLVTSITFVSGRTHVLQGVVHLVIFLSFLFFALVP
jgi:Ca2+:H+ antiporter